MGALRSLLRRPGFTAAAVLTLGLGIGAATTLFGVLRAVLFAPLPYPQPDRLVRIFEVDPRGEELVVSPPTYLDLRQRCRACAEVAASNELVETVALVGAGPPQQLRAAAVSASFFPLLGGKPLYGRTFNADEDVPGGARVAVASEAFWRRSGGGEMVGRRLQLDGGSVEIVGVMPAAFAGLGAEDVWLPLRADAAADRDDHHLAVFARLALEANDAALAAELSALASDLGRRYPSSNAGWGMRAVGFADWLVGPVARRSLWVLAGAVGLLLALACLNVAGLLLARATSRSGEIATRAALGAGRGRLAALLLWEAGWLGALGAAAGVALAAVAVRALHALDPGTLPRLAETRIDGAALAFAVAAGVLTSLLFGSAPAFAAARLDLARDLRRSGRGGARPGARLRDALVVAQTGLAVILLVVATLLLESVVRLRSVDTGIRSAGVVAVPLQRPAGEGADATARFVAQVEERLAALPGIAAVGSTITDPFLASGFVNDVTASERVADAPPGGQLLAGWRSITPGALAALGVPVLHGRGFTAADRDGGERVAIVTAALARDLWGTDDVVGRQLFFGGTTGTPRRVVGVVADFRDVPLTDAAKSLLLVPYDQVPMPGPVLLVRSASDPRTLAAAIRKAIWSVDPTLPVPEVRPLARGREVALLAPRARASLVASFAGVALMLAAVGLHGLLAFGVAQRRGELSVRMALGASPGQVGRQVVGRGLGLAMTGGALGLLAALGVSRLLAGLLYGVRQADPLSFAAAPLLLALVAVVAAWLPARHAAAVDPARTLRAE